MKTTKSRIIFFTIAITYNLLLGLRLKDFLVLSQTLTAFYLLSALPTLFLLIEARSRAMKAIVYISASRSIDALYGFRKLDSILSLDADYVLTRIY